MASRTRQTTHADGPRKRGGGNDRRTCDFGKDAENSPRCAAEATRKWGDHWFCEEHGQRGGAKSKGGRPPIYSDELAAEICRRLHESEEGELPESLRQICRDPEMPCMATVCDWLHHEDKSEFSEQYARAREMRKDALLDLYFWLGKEALKVANGAPGTGEAGARVQAIKLRMDAVKWVLSKEYAKDYGELLKQEISGPDGGPVETISSISPEVENEVIRIRDVRSGMNPPRGHEKKNQAEQK